MAEAIHPRGGEDDTAEIERRKADETERLLARTIAIGLPLVCVMSAVVVGFVASVGSGLLVAAAGALLGTIALLWASLRTLSGDAPLPSGLEELTQRDGVDALAEQKRRALRALKDLESERALGRIDDADYEAFQTRYREEAKDIMRRIDERAAPSRAEAERVATEYIARSKVAPVQDELNERPAKPFDVKSRPVPAAKRAERIACATCGESNESDAAFCKHCGSVIERTTDYTDARV